VYDILPSFILGFHGCDQAIADKIFAGAADLNRSTNTYDWLGHGIYFWEQNPQRAQQWANAQRERKKIKNPAVVGAVIDLGRCLNLLDAESLVIVRQGYEQLIRISAAADRVLPQNKTYTILIVP